MEFKKSSSRIWLTDETGKETAFVSFPPRDEKTVTIASTVVDRSLRGQGIASELLTELAKTLREDGKKAVPVCSYAVKWFPEHPEYSDLLADEK